MASPSAYCNMPVFNSEGNHREDLRVVGTEVQATKTDFTCKWFLHIFLWRIPTNILIVILLCYR